MNTKNKIKYRTTSIVFGILSLVSFVLGIGLFFFFSTLGEDRKEEAIYSVSALGTLLFFFLFFVFAILFVIFSILKKINARKMEKENKLPVMEEEKIPEDQEALYTYTDDRCMKLWHYFKGIYYASPVAFYTLLFCMIASYFLLLVPIKTRQNGAMGWACAILVILLFTYLFFFVFLIQPLCSIHATKKAKVTSMSKVYEDKLVVVNQAGTSGSSTQTRVTVNIIVEFEKISKIRKDKSAFYFNFINEKGRPACLVVTYEGVEGFPMSFFDEKMKQIANR